ncbi:hypothetical protein DFQ28_001739 [Apophysomyces sp. BC1034]|nr:hypothetical protein DFQ28_001739 [Apophysomyces sp. BC1034]
MRMNIRKRKRVNQEESVTPAKCYELPALSCYQKLKKMIEYGVNKKEEENILKKRLEQQQIPKTILSDACIFTYSSENLISKESLRYSLKGCNLSKYWQTYVKGHFDALYKEIVVCLQEKGTDDEDSEDDDEKNFRQKTVAKIDKYKLYKELSKKFNKSDIGEDEISDRLQELKNLQEHWFHFEEDIQSSTNEQSKLISEEGGKDFLIEDLQLKGLSDEQVVDILEELEELEELEKMEETEGQEEIIEEGKLLASEVVEKP